MDVTEKYLETLLVYYEEEVMGEAYFYGLVDHFNEREKLVLMARVERRAADAVIPLLEKYSLVPRRSDVLESKGKDWVARHESFDWMELMEYIRKRYPGYLDDFAALESMAPEEDLKLLGILTAHEVAAIEFAERELAGDPDSSEPLFHYLAL